MGQLHIIDHPLIQHKLTLLRNKNTGAKDFKELLGEIAMLMTYEFTRDLPLEAIEAETPLTTVKSNVVAVGLGIIPILRAGLGMVDGILKLIPTAKVGHIGLYRDHVSLQPVEYYCKLPADAQNRELIVLDPMLATGGSASVAISFLKKRNCSNIRLVCLIAAPEGIKLVRNEHSDVDIYVAAVDERLNDQGYIVPGLGDAGDRLFGTM